MDKKYKNLNILSFILSWGGIAMMVLWFLGVLPSSAIVGFLSIFILLIGGILGNIVGIITEGFAFWRLFLLIGSLLVGGLFGVFIYIELYDPTWAK